MFWIRIHMFAWYFLTAASILVLKFSWKRQYEGLRTELRNFLNAKSLLPLLMKIKSTRTWRPADWFCWGGPVAAEELLRSDHCGSPSRVGGGASVCRCGGGFVLRRRCCCAADPGPAIKTNIKFYLFVAGPDSKLLACFMCERKNNSAEHLYCTIKQAIIPFCPFFMAGVSPNIKKNKIDWTDP